VSRGITNAQAKQLAALQRRAGQRYSGAGMTRKQAAKAIRGLLSAPAQPPKPTRRTSRGGGKKPTAAQRAELLRLGHNPAGLTRRDARVVIEGLRDVVKSTAKRQKCRGPRVGEAAEVRHHRG
jgi:hypothetical protein